MAIHMDELCSFEPSPTREKGNLSIALRRLRGPQAQDSTAKDAKVAKLSWM